MTAICRNSWNGASMASANLGRPLSSLTGRGGFECSSWTPAGRHWWFSA
jgi:hypothetical protein